MTPVRRPGPVPPAAWLRSVAGWQDAVATLGRPAPSAGAPAALARPGLLTLQDVPAPARLAPFGVAVTAELCQAGRAVGDGRLVVLHDPAGQPGWRGQTRVVAFVAADVEPEMAADPLLPDVGWSWLTDALRARGAAHDAAGATVTRTASATYGELETDPARSELEVRASWTARAGAAGPDLVPHLLAWVDLLVAACGMPS